MTRTDLSEGKRNRKTQALSALLSASALGLFLEGCGGGTPIADPILFIADPILLFATPAVEKHVGDMGSDTVSYASSGVGVVVSLLANTGTEGDAAGDTFESIENLIGSAYADTLTGDNGDNKLEGGASGDTLRGHEGNDKLYGEAGTDELYGGVGDDVLNGGTGNDKLYGGEGADTASYKNSNDGVKVDLVMGPGKGGDAAGDTFDSIENLIGSDHPDTLAGNNEANTLTGGYGKDILHGGAGDDELYGGAYDDKLYGDDGNDTLHGGAGTDYLYGNEGNDTLHGGAGNDYLYGNEGDDTLHGGAGSDLLNGGKNGADSASYANAGSSVHVFLDASKGTNTGDAAGDTFDSIENLIGSDYDDTLTGNAGDNTLEGGKGDDTLHGDEGYDKLYGGAGADSASYANAGEAVTVSLADTSTNTGDARWDILKSIENLIGSAYGDTLTGDADDNTLEGGEGDDTLHGSAGNDELNGGEGTDSASYANAGSSVHVFLIASEGTNKGDAAGDTFTSIENIIGTDSDDELHGDDNPNTIHGGYGVDLIRGGDGDDILYGDEDGDELDGSAGNDEINGGEGDDLITGNNGDDTLKGGAGTDTYYYREGEGTDTIIDVRLEAINLLFAFFTRDKIDAAVITKDSNNLVIDFEGDNKITINDAYYTDDTGTEQEAFTINAYHGSISYTNLFADAYSLSFAA